MDSSAWTSEDRECISSFIFCDEFCDLLKHQESLLHVIHKKPSKLYKTKHNSNYLDIFIQIPCPNI